MRKLQSSICAACGAPLEDFSRSLVICKFCGTPYWLPEIQRYVPGVQAKPDIGDLLLGADFQEGKIPGWIVYQKENIQFRHQSPYPPELWVTLPGENAFKGILQSPGPLFNCDLSVNIRFISGIWDQIRAGVEFRHRDEGDYLVAISPQGTFCIGYHNERQWGDYLSKWGDHDSLNIGWEELNRLRVITRGDQIRVYLNGSLAASLLDFRYKQGSVMVVVGPIDGDAVVAFSDLQLRQVI